MLRRLYLPARWTIAVFCWLTALYAFVASSAFSYQQFIRPRVFASVAWFSDWHAALCWVWLAIVAFALTRDFQAGHLRRRLGVGLAATCSLAVMLLTLTRVVPRLSDNAVSLAFGSASLVPLFWFGTLDYVAADVSVAPAASSETESRCFLAAVATAVFVAVLYAALVPIQLLGNFEPELTTMSLGVGMIRSIADHLFIFSGVFLGIATLRRLTSSVTYAIRSLIIAAAATAVLAVVVNSMLSDAIGLRPVPGAIASTMLAASIIATVGGLRLRPTAGLPPSPSASLAEARGEIRASGGGKPRATSVRFVAARALVAILLLAFVLQRFAGVFDWDFVLLKAGVVVVWFAAFDIMYRLTPRAVHVAPTMAALICLVPLGIHTVEPATLSPRLERYSVYNASFRVADGLVRSGPTERRFDGYLRANTGWTDVDVRPISIDFVTPLVPTRSPKPWIFLFVIDSLRHDYLSVYDPSVGFTPNIERFARDSIVFRNAFTRYGGTGLSVPAIWSGSAILHKQYVMPFDPMNALAKLLSVNSYEQIVSVDSIMERIWTSGSRIQLDRGIPNVDFRFCRTVSELETRLDHIDRPVFAYTLPQDLHIGAVRTATVPAGESYPGRYAPYAARVRQIDACFGGFIDFLQKRGLYDRSLIVLTSDHGELLGEKGRWGHSYYMPPEVVQVPLIIHLPASADKGVVDPDAVALTTDITPTIYAALGYRPIRQTPLRGRTLIGRSAGDAEEQRGDVYVLAASYGAVYAVLRSNGRSLYVANGIKGGDAQYERQGAVWTEREVHDAERSMNEHAIIEHDEAVAREYRLR